MSHIESRALLDTSENNTIAASAQKTLLGVAAFLGCVALSAAAVATDRAMYDHGTALYAPVGQSIATVRPTTMARSVPMPITGSVQQQASVVMAASQEPTNAVPSGNGFALEGSHAAGWMFAPMAVLMAGLTAMVAMIRLSQRQASVVQKVATYQPRRWLMTSTAGLSQDELKKMVGYKSVDDHVRSGMVVGLGTGSTAAFAVERVGQKVASGELTDIICIPTSERTKEQAESLGIPLCTLNEKSHIDVSIDGADEVDPDWNLVKGGGGALLREKMVEIVSDKFICIVDESKLCPGLGPGFPLPVEITPFCHEHTMRVVAGLPAIAPYLKEAVLRMGSSSSNKPDGDNIAVTDNGNYIVDLHFKEMIKDAPAAAAQLKNTVGVVDHGLFIGMATEVIVAGSEGVYVMEKGQQ